MEKIAAFWDLFRKGQCIDNPEAWKLGQIAAPPLAAFIMALAHVFGLYGHAIPITEGAALTIAGSIIVVVNGLLTIATTAKLGFLPAKPVLPSAQPAAATGVQAGPVTANEDHPGVNEPNGYSDNG